MTNQIDSITRTAHDIKKVASLLSIRDNVTVLAAITHGAMTYSDLVAITGFEYQKCASIVHQIKRAGLVEVRRPEKAWKEYKSVRNEYTIHAIENPGIGGVVAKMIFEA